MRTDITHTGEKMKQGLFLSNSQHCMVEIVAPPNNCSHAHPDTAFLHYVSVYVLLSLIKS